MRNILVLATSMLILLGILGATAQSSEAACSTVGCVNKQIRNLKRSVTAIRADYNGLLSEYNGLVSSVATIRADHNGLVSCLQVAPITQYYGYLYDDPPYFETALDFTIPGDYTDGYALFNACQSASAPGARASAANTAFSFPRLDVGKPIER